MLHTKFQDHWSTGSGSGEEDFLRFLPRVIICTRLVVLPYIMLHTKFQGHGSVGSGEEDFLRFLPYMGMAAMLVMSPIHFYKFSFLVFLKLSYEFWFQITQLFLRKTSFNFEI